MSVYDHFLKKDQEQLDANLLIMHQALINIITSITRVDFETADNSFVQFQKSYNAIHDMHLDKKQGNDHEANEYMRRHYF
ncbi:hypothetical protein [Virgibacillus phage Mimir87]|nr:hypothetical protein [Virgibacillus phage Mimir87]